MGQVFALADVRARIRKLSTLQMRSLLERVVMTLFAVTEEDKELLDAENEWSSDNHDWLYDELSRAGLIPESREVEQPAKGVDT